MELSYVVGLKLEWLLEVWRRLIFLHVGDTIPICILPDKNIFHIFITLGIT